MKEAVIVEAVRTPMGRHSGILKDIRTDDLAAHIIAKLVEKPASIRKRSRTFTSAAPTRQVKTRAMWLATPRCSLGFPIRSPAPR